MKFNIIIYYAFIMHSKMRKHKEIGKYFIITYLYFYNKRIHPLRNCLLISDNFKVHPNVVNMNADKITV